MNKISSKAAITLPIVATLLFGFTALASANTDLLASLTDTQKEAITQIKEIRQKANEETRSIAEQAGLTPDILRQYHREENAAHRDAVQKAVENNDYNAFVEATADAPFASKVTQDFFNKFVEAWNLRENGDTEGAQAIMKELGIPGPRGGIMGHHRGMMKQFEKRQN